MPKTATKKTTTKNTTKKTIEPVVDDKVASDEEPEKTCSETMALLIADLDKLAKITRGLATNMKKIKKSHDKELKAALKAATKGKKRAKDPNAPKRPPSGFNKPGPLSKDLSKFLSVDAKVEMTRPEVTKMITAYIKKNNLQNPSNKRIIVPDKKLGKLLSGPTDGEDLTFFNLQKYIKHHFPKSTSVKK